MQKRILVLDDENDLIEAYKSIFGSVAPASAPAAAPVSSRRAAAGAPALVKKATIPYLENIEFTYVNSGEAAAQAVAEGFAANRPFLGGFFDMKLGPGIDGIETIRQIKEMAPELLCVVVTAYQDRNIEEITKIFGAEYSDRWDYLSKPFIRAEIMQKVINMVANWERRNLEKAHIAAIQKQQELERVIRDLLSDLFARVRHENHSASATTDLTQIKMALERMEQHTSDAERLLGEVLNATRQAA